jgi:ribosomal protein S18 acetylase RimI-like enzyme
MKLRPATKEDYDVLFELFSETQTMHYVGMPDFFKPAKKDKFFYTYFDEVIKSEDKHLIIGFDNDKPFGYIYYVISKLPQNVYRTEERIIYINHIVVKKSYQGRGLGRALINHAMHVANKEKIKKIGLDVWLFNEGAIKFFHSQGFSAHNQIMWHKITE